MTIHEIVRKQEDNYLNGTTTISEHVSFSMRETLNTIDAYLNSKHITGQKDALDRDKPFFNIVTAAVNIWYRATDIDRKNIRIKPTKKDHMVPAFMATVHLQEWMRRNNFGAFLNDWGRALSRYGSAVVKFVDQDGELKPSVIPWSRMIVDAVDFENNVHIEKLYLTPAQLKKNKSYNQDAVKALLDTRETRKTPDGNQKDNLDDYIEIYEVHGELPLSLYKAAKGQDYTETDENTYRQQMHVISFVSNDKGDFEDFTLFVGKEAQSPYMLTHLIKEEGRTLAIGAVEYLFDAQWMQNHSVQMMKDQLELASKLIFQTSDSQFVGRNALTAIQNGDILIHELNKPLTQINNGSHDITALQNFAQQWRVLAQDLTSTPDAIRGNTFPSGTAWRQVEALKEESHSLFEIMTENKGLHIEEMLRRFIIPSLKRKMDTSEEIAATLSEQGIAQIDSLFLPVEATKRYNKRTLDTIEDLVDNDMEGDMPEPFNPENEKSAVKRDMQSLGNQRFFTPDELGRVKWSEIVKDLEWDVEVEITGENADKQAVLATLSTTLSTIATNPMILQDPNAKMLFGKILEETGKVSPLELAHVTPPQPQVPVGNNAVGGAEALQGLAK